MLVQEVSRTYAQALFDSAKSKGLIDEAGEHLNDLRQYLAHDPALSNFLRSPRVLESDKRGLLRKAFASTMPRLLVEFLIVLVDKKRAVYLTEIIDEFIRLVEAENGIARATVITAKALEESDRQRLIEKLSAKTSMQVHIEEKVDTSIIGGVIVILHNEIIDGSVQHGLNLVREQLSKVRVH